MIRSRTIVVRYSFEVVTDVPERMSEEEFTRIYNQGTWCMDNALLQIDNTEERTGACACMFGKAEFVREATVEDEQRYKRSVNDLPT